MPSEPIKRAYSISIGVDYGDAKQADRVDLAIGWEILDAESPFCAGHLEWFDLPAVAADWICARLAKLTGNRSDYSVDGLTYRQVVKFEVAFAKLLVDLNARGVAMAGLKSSEKAAAHERLFRTKSKVARPRRGRR